VLCVCVHRLTSYLPHSILDGAFFLQVFGAGKNCRKKNSKNANLFGELKKKCYFCILIFCRDAVRVRVLN
jgi:hypothetical protein